MATHSSILAWRIPRTQEPGRLQSMGSQRVRHDSVTKHSTVVKNPPANAENIRDQGSIPESASSPGGGHGNPPVFLPGESHREGEPGGLQSIGLQRISRD